MCVSCVFSSRKRHRRRALVTGVQTCALPIAKKPRLEWGPGWMQRASSRLLVILCLGAALAPDGGPAAAAGSYTVEAAEFVVSVGDGEGSERSIASTPVPYLPDRA